jgi:hypothetical protein
MFFNFEVCHLRCVFRYNGLGYVIVKRTQLCGYIISKYNDLIEKKIAKI